MSTGGEETTGKKVTEKEGERDHVEQRIQRKNGKRIVGGLRKRIKQQKPFQ